MAQPVNAQAATTELGVTLDGLGKRYGDVEAVRDLTLDIPAGDSSRCSVRPAAARPRRSG
jgi:hypothetical protein